MLPTILREMGPGHPDDTPDRLPGVGRKIASFALEPLTGAGKASSLQNLAGNVTVVNFWGTWCGPCRLEFPELVELGRQLRGHQDFRMYLVSCGEGRHEDFGDLKENAEAFLRQFDEPVQTYWDSKGQTRGAFAQVAPMQGLPTTFVLDREGVIRGIWPGYHPQCVHEIRQLVKRLLASEKRPDAKQPSQPTDEIRTRSTEGVEERSNRGSRVG